MREQFTEPVSGASYSVLYRVLATALLLVVFGQGVRVTIAVPQIDSGGWLWLGLGFFVMIATYVLLMLARTTIDAKGLHQTGLLGKEVAWDEITAARVTGFALSRRLAVRTISGRYKVFHGGTPQLVASFKRIVEHFPATTR